MADMAKVTHTLKLTAEFVDGDTRVLSFDNPKADLTAAEIDALAPIMVKCLVGDKTSAAFLRWKKASKFDDTKVTFDMRQ